MFSYLNKFIKEGVCSSITWSLIIFRHQVYLLLESFPSGSGYFYVNFFCVKWVFVVTFSEASIWEQAVTYPWETILH